MLTREKLSKYAFKTYEEADKKRMEIEALYPKRWSKRRAAAMIQSHREAKVSTSATRHCKNDDDGFVVPAPRPVFAAPAVSEKQI